MATDRRGGMRRWGLILLAYLAVAACGGCAVDTNEFAGTRERSEWGIEREKWEAANPPWSYNVSHWDGFDASGQIRHFVAERPIGDEEIAALADFPRFDEHRYGDDPLEIALYYKREYHPHDKIYEKRTHPVTDRGLASLANEVAERFPNLDSVTLSRTPNVTDAGLEALGGMAGLRGITLIGMETITDRGIAALARMDGLGALGIHGCPNITDAALEALETAPALKGIALNDSDRITDAGLASLARIPALVNVTISNCPRITNEGLLHLASMESLEYLNILGNKNITGQGMAALPTRRLRHLDIRDCPNITDEGLMALTPDTEKFFSVTIVRTGITEAGKEAFKQKHPRVSVYDNDR